MVKVFFLIVLSFSSLTVQAKSGGLWEYSIFHLCLLEYGDSSEVKKMLNQLEPQAHKKTIGLVDEIKPYQKCVRTENIRSKKFCRRAIADGLNMLGLRASVEQITSEDFELMNPTISRKLDQCSMSL